MKIERVEAENFLCFETLTLPLAGQGLVCILGRNMDSEAANSNGSGKSSLFKAISWGLYGQTVDGMRFDEVIRKGSTTATVRVFFAGKDGVWVLTRSRSKGKPRFTLAAPGGAPVDTTAEGLQAQVESWLGMDFHAFKNTVLYGQGDAVRFADPRTTDTERKEMLFRILRMEILGRCHDLALARRKTISVEVERRETLISQLQAKVDGIGVEGLVEQSERWEEDRKTSVATLLESARSLLAEARSALKAPRDMLEPLKNKLSRMEARSRELGVNEKLMEELRRELNAKQKALKQSEMKVGMLHAERGNIEKALARIEGDVCPVCTSPLTKGAPAALRKDLESKRSGTFSKEEVLILDIDIGEKAERSTQEKIDDELAKARARTKAAEKKLQEERELRGQIDALNRKASEGEGKKARAADLLKRANERREEENPFFQIVDQAREKVEAMLSDVETLLEDNKHDLHDLAEVEFWVRGFSPKGLPSYILDQVMVLLTDRANHYLHTLSDSDIQVSFATQRELKSKKGEVRDEIAITWQIEGQEDVQPSGGQWKKIEIATDLALMDLVATKEDSPCQLLLLDEVLDGLDREGRRRVVALLRELRERKDTVMVVSHEPDLLDEFERVLSVTKRDNVATLGVGGGGDE